MHLQIVVFVLVMLAFGGVTVLYMFVACYVFDLFNFCFSICLLSQKIQCLVYDGFVYIHLRSLGGKCG